MSRPSTTVRIGVSGVCLAAPGGSIVRLASSGSRLGSTAVATGPAVSSPASPTFLPTPDRAGAEATVVLALLCPTCRGSVDAVSAWCYAPARCTWTCAPGLRERRQPARAYGVLDVATFSCCRVDEEHPLSPWLAPSVRGRQARRGGCDLQSEPGIDLAEDRRAQDVACDHDDKGESQHQHE